ALARHCTAGPGWRCAIRQRGPEGFKPHRGKSSHRDSTTRLLDLFDRIRSQLWRVEKVGDVKPQGHLAIAAQFVIKIKPFEILSGAVHPREPKLIGFMDSQTQSREPLFATGFGHDLGN